MYRGRQIFVIVPAYQEARRVGDTLRRIPGWVDGIIVIDDGSTDGTSQAVAFTDDDRIRLLRHAENQGVGRTIVTGYQAAMEASADIMVVMAGDGQMDPLDLPALLDPIVEGRADYVKGNRFNHPDRRRMPRARRYAGKMLGAVTRVATGYGIDDSQCGYTALDGAAARALALSDLWPGYGYPNDLLGLLAGAGRTVAEVPVRPIYAGEESGVRFWHFAVVLAVIARRAARTWLAEAPSQRTAVPFAR